VGLAARAGLTRGGQGNPRSFWIKKNFIPNGGGVTARPPGPPPRGAGRSAR
jgi:hypothetical protein